MDTDAVTEIQVKNIWYLANGEKGFTSDPEMAVHDLTGAAVVAPGHVRRIINRIERDHNRQLAVQRRAVEAIWELLLDAIEEVEQRVSETTVLRNGGKQDSLTKALAILELGHDYKEDPEATIGKIQEMALVRYDAAVEA